MWIHSLDKNNWLEKRIRGERLTRTEKDARMNKFLEIGKKVLVGKVCGSVE
jgi:hypothetical protein